MTPDSLEKLFTSASLSLGRQSFSLLWILQVQLLRVAFRPHFVDTVAQEVVRRSDVLRSDQDCLRQR